MSDFSFSKPMASDVAFRTDAHKYDKDYRCVYVEGKKDKRFYLRILRSNVRCVSMDELTTSDGFFRIKSNRDTILLNVPRFESPPIFGVIDRDNDVTITSAGVFHTDTRDLETLLMYTDDNVHQKLDTTLTATEVMNAIFMAYQWGCLTEEWKLFRNEEDIIAGVETCFDENHKIDVDKVRTHLKHLGATQYPSNQELKQFKRTYAKLSGSIWGEDVETIDWTRVDGAWNYIRGHDLIYFLITQNAELTRRFYQHSPLLEYNLIDQYDIACFKRCGLYASLCGAQLLAL